MLSFGGAEELSPSMVTELLVMEEFPERSSSSWRFRSFMGTGEAPSFSKIMFPYLKSFPVAFDRLGVVALIDEGMGWVDGFSDSKGLDTGFLQLHLSLGEVAESNECSEMVEAVLMSKSLSG